MRQFSALLTALAFTLAPAFAGEPKPVPQMQVLPLPNGEASFQRDGQEIARYYFGSTLKRPFVYPVIGPSGRSLTRMGHPHDPESHSHHNSVWVSHQFIGDTSFWEDRGPARIAHQRILRYEDGDTEAFIESENAWLNKDGAPLMRELRRTTVQALPEKEWLLLIEMQWEPKQELVLGQTAFGPLGVRMAKTIGVADGGGTIRNSEGGVDEDACFRKPAKWVDYSGPIAPGATEGITLFDHPSNPNHPVPFHVRSDGWMGAALTFPGPITLKPAAPLRLRYALYIHAGQPAPAKLQAQWEAFARTEWREFAGKKK
jgi:hypothetical protein